MHPLAEIVLDSGLASQEDLRRAAEEADTRKTPLVVVLIRDYGVDELAMLRALKKATRVPVTDPANTEVDTEALRQISREDCRRLRVAPLSLQVFASGPSTMRIAMADPTDAVLIAEVEHLSRTRVEPTLMTLSAVEELVEKSYGQFVTEVMTRKKPGTVPLEARVSQTTVPFLRVIDEADASVRLDALMKLLIEKELITEDEYEEAVRVVLKSRS
jgi:type IV pilus assembly protein PilB